MSTREESLEELSAARNSAGKTWAQNTRSTFEALTAERDAWKQRAEDAEALAAALGDELAQHRAAFDGAVERIGAGGEDALAALVDSFAGIEPVSKPLRSPADGA
jgi:hypothetical protein